MTPTPPPRPPGRGASRPLSSGVRPVCRPAASSRSTPQTGSVCPCGALHSGRQGCALRAQILTRSPSGLRLPVWPLTPSAPQLPSLELAERCAASHGRARARRHFSQDRVLTSMVRPGHPGRRRRRRGGRKQPLRRDDPCAVRRRLCRRSAQQLTGAGGRVCAGQPQSATVNRLIYVTVTIIMRT